MVAFHSSLPVTFEQPDLLDPGVQGDPRPGHPALDVLNHLSGRVVLIDGERPLVGLAVARDRDPFTDVAGPTNTSLMSQLSPK
jgi:hypothetical protein